MHRCCPEACGVSPLSEAECNALSASGNCVYPRPNDAQMCKEEEGDGASTTATCKSKDNDKCLQLSKHWGASYTCAKSTGYCTSWAKDMHRCCPEACGTGPLSEAECNALSASGSCVYPNHATFAGEYEVVGTAPNAITIFAVIGALTIMYHGLKKVHKMMFAKDNFQEINQDETEC